MLKKRPQRRKIRLPKRHRLTWAEAHNGIYEGALRVPFGDVAAKLGRWAACKRLGGRLFLLQNEVCVSLNAYDLSAGVFVRGLTNLKMQLTKAEAHAAASGRDEATLLDAQLARDGQAGDVARDTQYDLHTYTLAAQVHWAAEGAKLAIAQVLGARPVPAARARRGRVERPHRPRKESAKSA